MVDVNTDPKEQERDIELDLEDDESEIQTIEQIRSQIYQLDVMLTRVKGRIELQKRSLDMSRSLPEHTQKLIDLGVSLYDLDSNYEVRI